MEVVLLGATGLVGFNVLLLLLEDPKVVKVHVVSRKKVPALNPKIDWIAIQDLSDLKKIDNLSDQSVYISCLGTTIKNAGSKEAFKKVDLEANLDFAELAFRSRAQKLILVSAAGANPGSLIFYNRVKGKCEQLIQKIGLEQLVIFRPGLLLGDRQEQRSGEKFAIDVVRSLKGRLPSRWIQMLSTEVMDLAKHIHRHTVRNEQSSLVILEASEIGECQDF